MRLKNDKVLSLVTAFLLPGNTGVVLCGRPDEMLRLRQIQNVFHEGIKFRFGQLLCLWCNALNGCPTGNQPVRPLFPGTAFQIRLPVFQTLHFPFFPFQQDSGFFIFLLQLFQRFFHVLTSFADKIKKDHPQTVCVSVLL
ncbi:hypothetical protein QQC_0308 [Clostridioides difficile Y358]|nr:hypothetical protein QQC_0308 [Clostridioides difficile Y358]